LRITYYTLTFRLNTLAKHQYLGTASKFEITHLHFDEVVPHFLLEKKILVNKLQEKQHLITTATHNYFDMTGILAQVKPNS